MLESENAVIIATGPSLTRDDCEMIKALHWPIYAVNDAIFWTANHADYLYACDYEWWDYHNEGLRGVRANKITCNNEASRDFDLDFIQGESAEAAGKPVDISGLGIIYGGNSGFQALNLAAFVHKRKNIILLGFDCGHAEGEPKHCYGEHPPECDNPSPFNTWRKHYREAAPVFEKNGVKITNCTRRTFLDCFECRDLEQVLTDELNKRYHALNYIAEGHGVYGSQAFEYKNTARAALGIKEL